MAGFLSIPLKQARPVHLEEYLRDVFKSIYKDDETSLEIANEGARKLSVLRREATDGSFGKHETLADAIALYYDQLMALERALPLGCLRLEFSWKAAFEFNTVLFGDSSVYRNSSFGFEKLCVLYNYAAALSLSAAFTGDYIFNDDNALHKCTINLLTSAGVLQHLKLCTQLFTQDPRTTSFVQSLDLQPDTLNHLLHLTLAQAQECFYLKAKADQRKEETLAQIAFRAHELYALCQKSVHIVKQYVHKDWILIIKVKDGLFESLAQYHMARAAHQRMKFDETLSRMAIAVPGLRKAVQDLEYVTSKVIGSYVRESYREAELFQNELNKQNGFLFHAKCVDPRNLPELKAATLAKPKAINFPLTACLSFNLFSALPVVDEDKVSKVRSDRTDGETFNEQMGEWLTHALAQLNTPQNPSK